MKLESNRDRDTFERTRSHDSTKVLNKRNQYSNWTLSLPVYIKDFYEAKEKNEPKSRAKAVWISLKIANGKQCWLQMKENERENEWIYSF